MPEREHKTLALFPSQGKGHDNDDDDDPAAILFQKFHVQHVSRPHETQKPAFSNSSGLKSVFQKAPFRWQISVDGRPNVVIKLRFELPLAHWGRACIHLSEPWNGQTLFRRSTGSVVHLISAQCRRYIGHCQILMGLCCWPWRSQEEPTEFYDSGANCRLKIESSTKT